MNHDTLHDQPIYQPKIDDGLDMVSRIYNMYILLNKNKLFPFRILLENSNKKHIEYPMPLDFIACRIRKLAFEWLKTNESANGASTTLEHIPYE